MIRRIHFTIALLTAFIGIASLPSAAQAGGIFYIDYASGSNANNGTSKSTPWKTHPYMQTGASCTGTGSAPLYTHVAGDHFIFKGGVRWPAACFGMVISGSGTASAQDYYGVDKTWYSGGSWTRPVFDAANATPTKASFVIMSSISYVTFDNLEMKRQLTTNSTNECTDAAFNMYGGTGILIENGYIHDWISTAGNSLTYHDGTGGLCINGGAATADHMTISDESGTPVPFGGCFRNIGEVKNSVCHDVGQGVNGYTSVHDSEFYNITDVSATSPYTNAIHTNVIQQTWPGGTGAVYNNLIHDNRLGQVVGMCPTTDFYNNVMWNNSGAGADILVDTGVNACTVNTNTVANIYNNSVDCSNGVYCLRVTRGGYAIGTVNYKNNQWVTSAIPVSIELSVTTLNQSNNVTMSPSTAASQGYTSSNKYAPTSSSSSTVGAGAPLNSLCSVGLAPLCSDPEGAPWYGGSYAARPSGTAAWDAGAYQFGGQSESSNPSPPSNLAAIVQ